MSGSRMERLRQRASVLLERGDATNRSDALYMAVSPQDVKWLVEEEYHQALYNAYTAGQQGMSFQSATGLKPSFAKEGERP